MLQGLQLNSVLGCRCGKGCVEHGKQDRQLDLQAEESGDLGHGRIHSMRSNNLSPGDIATRQEAENQLLPSPHFKLVL